MRRAGIVLATAAALLVPAIGPATLATAASTGSGTPLPLQSFSGMLVDTSHNHLVFSDYLHGVLVTDFAGHTIASIPEPGAEDIALSPDNATLYVAMGTSDTIAAIDTNTLTEVARYDTGQGVQPHAVAFTAGKIWFGYRQDSTGGLGSIDPAQGSPSETLEEIGRPGPLQASPAAPGRLLGSFVVGDGELDTFDVSSGTPQVIARKSTWSYELAISPDGKYVATNLAGVLRLDDLTPSGLYPDFPDGYKDASALAFAPDDTLAFAEQDGTGSLLHYVVHTLGTLGAPLRTYTFGPEESGDGVIAGLGWAPEGRGLLALDAQGDPYSLRTLTDPEMADTELVPVEIDPSQPVAGQPFDLKIAVGSAKGFDGNPVLHVTRTDATHPAGITLPDVPVTFEGSLPTVSFVIHDTAPASGTYSYQLTLDRDATHMAASATATVRVRHTTTLSIAANATAYSYGATATVTAHLGATHNSRTVSIYAQPYDGKKALIKTGTVDSRGNLATSYKLTHNTTFTAAFAGDSGYAPATATRIADDHVKVTESLSGYYTNTHYGSTLYRVYHHTAKAKLNTTVMPNKAGQCFRFQTQRYYSSAWHTLTTSACSALSTTSTGSGAMALTRAIGYNLRMRAEYVHSTNDNTNLSTWGTWQYLTVKN
jgi:YVTN family beta-propeller protein